MHAVRHEPTPFALAVSPSGVPYLRAPQEGDEALDGPHSAPIAEAFERGAGAGIRRLGAVEVGTPLPAPFAFFRDLGHELVASVCARADLEETRDRVDIVRPTERLEAMATAAPPGAGTEYVTAGALGSLWESTSAELRRELAAWRGTVADYLRSKHPAWSVVGRVHFHLAENKRDPDAPLRVPSHLPRRAFPRPAPRSTGRWATRSKSTGRRAIANGSSRSSCRCSALPRRASSSRRCSRAATCITPSRGRRARPAPSSRSSRRSRLRGSSFASPAAGPRAVPLARRFASRSADALPRSWGPTRCSTSP